MDNSNHIGYYTEEKYISYSVKKLISIIESDEDDYTLQAKEMASKVLDSRSELPETINYYAKSYWKKTIRYNFKKLLGAKGLPISQFLSEQELRELFRIEFQKWKNKKELLSVEWL